MQESCKPTLSSEAKKLYKKYKTLFDSFAERNQYNVAVSAEEDGRFAYAGKKAKTADSSERQEMISNRDFSEDFVSTTLNSFGIKKLNDYIHIQRQVLSTLINEDFFTDTDARSRTDVNKELGLVIETNKSGIDETFSFNNFVRLGKYKKVAKLATIRQLPNAIKYGHIVADNVANKYNSTDHNKKFAYIEYKTEVDGQEIIVKLAIKKSPQKNKFWVHSIYTIENVSDSPAITENGNEAGHITADNGKIIPEEKPIVNSENELLSDRDSDYLDAVNRGDMETAQRMVDEVAKDAGYDVKGYHGTKADFTELMKSMTVRNTLIMRVSLPLGWLFLMF